MLNPKLEQRMLTLIAQTYALEVDELNLIYTEIQSIDKLLAIIDLQKRLNINLQNAYINWKN